MPAGPDDTDLPGVCEGEDACEGCLPEGTDAFTCDCRVTEADDPATCRPIRVLILDDDDALATSSGGYLAPLLEQATWAPGTPKFDVRQAGPEELYTDWAPVNAYEDYIEDEEPKTWNPGPATEPVAQLVRADLPTTWTMRHSIEDTTAKTAAQTLDVDTLVALTVTYDDGTDPAREVPGVVVWPSAAGHGTILWMNTDLAYLADPPDFVPMQEPEMATLLSNVAQAAASGL